jgi:acyl-coenzyme A synthetase/AMP-(fatty) acid ligase
MHDKSSRAFQSVLGERPLVRDIVVPELHDWITEKEAEPYEYNKSWEEAANDPWIIFHTSGTTGQYLLASWVTLN